jgi:hypothetical protein
MTSYVCNFDHAKPFSDTCFQAALATNVAQTYTVPGDATQKYRAKFEFNASANIYVGYNVAALPPGAGLNTSTANMEFRPSEPKFVKGGDVLSFRSPDAGSSYVGVSLLAIPG